MMPGDRFGDYTVVRRLGKGGMGEVWLLQSASGGLVAAKILDSTDHEARRRFLREAEFALGVKHPNLVETYDVGEDPDTGLCYILMEYVPGGTLADRLHQSGAMPVDDAVAVVRAMADILELGRQKGIVHRDIKPANIMFDAEGTPKLADLGIARGGINGTDTTTVTQTGMMIGTPAYMSPEQMLDAHHVDTRADIYSLGVVFFEMLTGQRPNKDDTVMQLMAKAVKGEPLPDVRTLRPEVSASLAQLLNMMVAPDKDQRISTPRQITNALALIARGESFGRAKKTPWPLVQFGKIKRLPRKVLIPAGLLVLLVIIVAAVLPGKKDKGTEKTLTKPLPSAFNDETTVPTNETPNIVKKIGKDDFKIELTGVAVVEDETTSSLDNAAFVPPASRLEVFGRVALFEFEYDFPTNYAARICVQNWQTADKDGRPVSFLFNPSSEFRGRGIAIGRIILGSDASECELRDIQVSVMPTPRLEESERTFLCGPFGVNIRFVKNPKKVKEDEERKRREKMRRDAEAVQKALGSLFPGWRISDPALCSVTNGMLIARSSVTLSNNVVKVAGRNPTFHMRLANRLNSQRIPLCVRVNGRSEPMTADGDHDFYVGLSKWKGLRVRIELEQDSTNQVVRWTVLEVGDSRRWNEIVHEKEMKKALKERFPGWEVSDIQRCSITNRMLQTHASVTISGDVSVKDAYQTLCLKFDKCKKGQRIPVRVKVDGKGVLETVVVGSGGCANVKLGKWLGKKVRISLDHYSAALGSEALVWSAIDIGMDTPPPSPPPLPPPPGPAVSRFQGWSVALGKAYSEDVVSGRRGQVLTQSHTLFSRTVKVPRADGFPKPKLKLCITVACEPGEKSYLFVKVAGVPVGDRVISSSAWKTHEFDVSRWEGQEVFVEVDCAPSERKWSRMHWQQIKVK